MKIKRLISIVLLWSVIALTFLALSSGGQYFWISFILILIGLLFMSLYGVHETLELRGYDPVTYIEKPRPHKGSMDYQVIIDGKIFYFVSEENRNKFRHAPEKYFPKYDGWCAWSLSQGKEVKGDPHYYHVEDNAFFLFSNEEFLHKWLEDYENNHRKADFFWLKVKTE